MSLGRRVQIMGLLEELGRITEPRPQPEPPKTESDDAGNGDVISQLRKIVKDHSADKINGMTVDAWSASAAIKVYDGLSPDNQRKMASLPIKKMMNVVFKMLEKKTK